MDNTKIWELNWGPVTPEGFNSEKNQAIIVMNVDLTSIAKVEHVVAYVAGKISWYALHLPKNASQLVYFDITGQKIPEGILDSLQARIKSGLPESFDLRRLEIIFHRKQ